jgi:pyridoxal phosphate enzyme (YggS family)
LSQNSAISDNLRNIRARIDHAARANDRDPVTVSLLAASKAFGPDRVSEAAAAGQTDFGENYLQEALAKMDALSGLPLCWHFIGPIQSNKTRPIAERFAWVHSIDRLKIAERLSAQRPQAMPPLQVCLEVNVSAEASKGGVAPADLPKLAHAVAGLPRLRLRGLMAIPAPERDAAAQRAAFRRVRRLFESLRDSGLELDTLSMGMSGDLEAAIAEGATIVRVGTAIFGNRDREHA